MTAPVRTVLSWSGGKDSALALHELLMDPAVDLRGLLTTVTDGYDRVSMHGVRMSLRSAPNSSRSGFAASPSVALFTIAAILT